MNCKKCSREIVDCEECAGTGTVAGEVCEVCDGAMRGCPVHQADWLTASYN